MLMINFMKKNIKRAMCMKYFVIFVIVKFPAYPLSYAHRLHWQEEYLEKDLNIRNYFLLLEWNLWKCICTKI